MSTNPDKETEKQRTKRMLLEKLRNIKIKSEGAPSVASVSNHPIRINNNVDNERRPMGEPRFNKMEPEKQKQIKSEMVDEADEERKLPNQQGYKEEIEKDLKKTTSIRAKRPYYEHYSKEGVFEPVLDYVRNHPNPSGRPDNIPPQMYEGIEVVPKRPWVFFGPENIPPSDCQQINEEVFAKIFRQAKKNKGSGIYKKSNKKKGMKKNQDEISQVSDQFTSNFTFSDSVDLSKESDLISQFRTQTKTLKVYDSAIPEQSEVDDDFSSMSGSVTQRHRYNLFDSSQSQMQESSIEISKRRRKFKKLLQSSDDQPEKSKTNLASSAQVPNSSALNSGSTGNVQVKISSKGSSQRVEIDQNQSSMSKSRSKSKSRAQMRPAPAAQPTARNSRRATRQTKPMKEESDSS